LYKKWGCFFPGILEQAMEERPQTTYSGGTCKTWSSSSTQSNEMTSHREWTAFQGPVVYTGKKYPSTNCIYIEIIR
jgi:hypothetical protein